MITARIGAGILTWGVMVFSAAAWGEAARDQSVPATVAECNNPVVHVIIPLRDGRLCVADVLQSLCAAIEADCNAMLGALDEPIDAAALVEAVGLDRLGEITRGIASVAVDREQITLTIDKTALAAAGAEARRALAAWIVGAFGGDGSGGAVHYGIRFVTPETGPIDQLKDAPRHAVVLIHGVDDPGWMWRDVIPVLKAKGLTVARFDYPNDGPIAEDADLLAGELQKLRSAGVMRIDIVGKSMGGLVAREVLTRPAYYNGDGRGGERLPTVDRFIMVGTPNHGSGMAKLRCVSEWGEHLGRVFCAAPRPDGAAGICWFDFCCDGDGEAGVDLLPDSDFLRRLNARPLAAHVRHTIIAARLSPVSEEDVRQWSQRVRQYADSQGAPGWLRELLAHDNLQKLNGSLAQMVRGLGDGLVSIDSARLEGVGDFVVVEADHVGMICNVLPSVRRPAAVPIIVERLTASPLTE